METAEPLSVDPLGRLIVNEVCVGPQYGSVEPLPSGLASNMTERALPSLRNGTIVGAFWALLCVALTPLPLWSNHVMMRPQVPARKPSSVWVSRLPSAKKPIFLVALSERRCTVKAGPV